MQTGNYHIGFTTLSQEVQLEQLPVSGQLPSWLTGTLMRNGPAKFEVGTQSYRHWFDGLAMLHKFSFRAGQVSYSNKFLESKSYTEAQERGKISRSEFATDPCTNIFGRLRAIFSPRFTDNANVNLTKFAEGFAALTETPFPVIFDSSTLKATGFRKIQDRVDGQVTTAHPHFDFARREMFSYLTSFSRRSAYNIYRVDRNGKRSQLGLIPVEKPAYMHSFGMTQNYMVLAEFPLLVNPLRLLLGNQPFIESYRWLPERGTRFLIISKETGQLVQTCESDSFFAFHHVNAKERGDEVILDIIAYKDSSIINMLYLDKLKSGTLPAPTSGQLRRYYLPLNRSLATYEALCEETIELPRIDYARCNTVDYQFLYGVGNRSSSNFLDSLVKVDVRRNSSQVWWQEDCYPGEPVYVASPEARTEDDGVVLSVVLDGQTQTSFLLVLDAQSFTEIARAEVSHHIPFGFHGQYFDELIKPTGLANPSR